MQEFDPSILKKLYKPAPDSHKGQNGKLLIIGGSHLFHAASLWSLTVASRIVDMVFYSSVDSNNTIVQKEKEEFRNGIVVPRSKIENYIEEADCVLIGPGMVRTDDPLQPTEEYQIKNLSELDEIEHEGIQTYYLTKYLLQKYPQKKWVIDAGALQMMECSWLLSYRMQHVVLIPHQKEFERLFGEAAADKNIAKMANNLEGHDCIILLKGQTDIICRPQEDMISSECVRIVGGNAGMTKGGTGDVLAGLVAALACKNDLFLSAVAGSYINKKAGEQLAKRVGFNFNSSDLALEIPRVMNSL